MSNFQRTRFEWPLVRRTPGDGERMLVLIADFKTGYSGVGHYVSFNAEDHIVIFDGPYAGDVRIHRLSSGPTYYSRNLSYDDDLWALAILVDAITGEQLVGSAAHDAVWTIFFRLVIEKDRDWIDGLGHAWLSELADEVAGKREKSRR